MDVLFTMRETVSIKSNQMQLHTDYFICKLLYTFRAVSPPIISSINNCIYSIWYWSTFVSTCLSHEGVQSLNSSTIATRNNNR